MTRRSHKLMFNCGCFRTDGRDVKAVVVLLQVSQSPILSQSLIGTVTSFLQVSLHPLLPGLRRDQQQLHGDSFTENETDQLGGLCNYNIEQLSS